MRMVWKKMMGFILTMAIFSTVSCGIKEVNTNLETSTSVSNSTQSVSTAEGNIEEENIGSADNVKALFPAQQSFFSVQNWGYIDDSGRFVLEPKLTSAFRFQPNGLAFVSEEEKLGIIDKAAQYVLEPTYLYISDFSEGLAIAQSNDGYAVINESGKVISKIYSDISNYKNGRAVFSEEAPGGTYRNGYLDKNGKVVIAPVYEYAGDFDSDLALIKFPDEEGYSLIDKNGRVLKEFEYKDVSSMAEGMYAFHDEESNMYGFINIDGQVIIPPRFMSAEIFKNGVAVVNVSSDYFLNEIGLIDKKGNYIFEPKYDEILMLGEDRVALGVAFNEDNPSAGSKYALASTDGIILTEFSYYNINPFKDGLASAYDGKYTFFIDLAGEKIVDLPNVMGAGTLELLDGVIYADIDQRYYYMDRKGNLIYSPSKSIVLNNGIKINEEKFVPNRDYLVFYPSLGDMEDKEIEAKVNSRLRELWVHDVTIAQNDILDHHLQGGFTLGFNKNNLLELEDSGYDYPFGAAHGMPYMEYVHLDIKTGKFYELKDLFKDGADYVGVVSKVIKQQIKKNGEEMGVYPQDFNGISQNQSFYLNEDELTIYFYPYEIASYAVGFPSFPIPYSEISDIIDKKGSFWLSFN